MSSDFRRMVVKLFIFANHLTFPFVKFLAEYPTNGRFQESNLFPTNGRFSRRTVPSVFVIKTLLLMRK